MSRRACSEDMGHPGRQLQISYRLGNWSMVWHEMRCGGDVAK